MTLCAPCKKKSDGWLDYRVSPSLKIASGASRDDTPAGVADARRARYDTWRNTIRTQQELIRRLCAEQHQAVEAPSSQYTLDSVPVLHSKVGIGGRIDPVIDCSKPTTG